MGSRRAEGNSDGGRAAVQKGLGAVGSLYDDPVLYDLLVEPEPHRSFYRDLAVQQGGSVLELACGSGQLLVPIAERGLRSVGIDASPPMLGAARDRAAAAGVEVELHEADMRSFSLGERFSLVFVGRNSWLHLHEVDDFLRCLAQVRDHLEEGGLFALDVYVPNPASLARDSSQRHPVAVVIHPERGRVEVQGVVDYDSVTQVNRATWFASTHSEPDYLVAAFHLRCIFPQELPLLLERGGFRLEERFGGFEQEPFDAQSTQQVCLCRAL